MLNLIHHLLPLEAQRKRLVNKVSANPLAEYLSVPFYDGNTSIKDICFLSLDFETTGFDSVKDQILSMGYTQMTDGRIAIGKSRHTVIKVKRPLEEDNVVIHKITDSDTENGCSLKNALDELLAVMTGKVLLVHYAKIEKSFIQQACKQIYGIEPPLQIVDTIAVAKRYFDKNDIPYDPSELRLQTLRERFHLPKFQGHNALHDAIATAELFLAEVNHYHQGLETKLSQVSL